MSIPLNILNAMNGDSDRRQFLRGLAAGALALGSTAKADDPKPGQKATDDKKPGEAKDGGAREGDAKAGEAKAGDAGTVRVPKRRLGKTGLDVPILEVGGTYRFNNRYVQAALDLGCTFFDTAQVYVNGKSEETLGQAIGKLGVRKDVTVVTKGHPGRPDDLAASVQTSLDRMKMDHVDIFYIHNLSRPETLADATWKAAVEKLKKAGKIRFFGFSAHNENVNRLLTDAGSCGWIDVIMFKYNFRSYGDAELNKAIDAAHRGGVGLIAMKTQGSAASFETKVDPFKKAGYSKHQAVLKAVWKDERIASAVSAMPSIAVLQENAAAATQKLTLVEERLLEEYAAATARHYCHGGCGGCRRECEAASGGLAIADTLRYLMYHDAYGQRALARAEFANLSPERTAWSPDTLVTCEAACPMGVAVGDLLGRADVVLRA